MSALNFKITKSSKPFISKGTLGLLAGLSAGYVYYNFLQNSWDFSVKN